MASKMNVIGWCLLLLTPAIYTAAEVCPSSHCSCIRNVIECSHNNFSTVPTFSRVHQHYTSLILSHNALRNLQPNAFSNLDVETIELDNNLLTHIDINAFNGLERRLTKLNISNNKLQETPSALKSLKVLKTLDVTGNLIPSPGYKDDVFFVLGTNLTELYFGDDSLSTWPKSLHHLQTLHTLYFQGASMTGLPYNAFQGFELTLHTLSLSKTSLFQVPLAVSRLVHLQNFIYDDNPKTGDAGMIPASFYRLNISSLSIKNNSLKSIPGIISQLTKLNALYMDRNYLWYIDDSSVYNVNSQLRILSLVDCKLDRIPHSLLQIIVLKDLDLSYNNINSIYSNDLIHNTGITKINLAHNPLKYISSGALGTLPNLSHLDMSNTKLTSVPRAILNIALRVTINLEHCLIECTCDLTWLEPHIDDFTIKGDCDTISETIEVYMRNRVPDC